MFLNIIIILLIVQCCLLIFENAHTLKFDNRSVLSNIKMNSSKLVLLNWICQFVTSSCVYETTNINAWRPLNVCAYSRCIVYKEFSTFMIINTLNGGIFLIKNLCKYQFLDDDETNLQQREPFVCLYIIFSLLLSARYAFKLYLICCSSTSFRNIIQNALWLL